MAFRFKLSEPFDEGSRRVAREQFERAQSQLKTGTDAAVAVHETRKCLKRLRALLRLIRPAIGDTAFRSENAHLREIGVMLSSARDRHVLIETITKLEATSGHDGLGDPVRKLLTEQNGEQGDDVDAAAMKRALKELDQAQKRCARLRISGRGFAVVGGGLEASYRRARRAFHDSYETQTDEAFHEWRKGAQQHWRHMVLLSRAWTDCMDARIAEARQLSQLLGDDHDLAILAAFVRSERAAAIADENVALIEKLARERQARLRAIARPVGDRLFAEGAKALRRRMAAYWEAAAAYKEVANLNEEKHAAPKPKAAAATKEPCADAPAKASALTTKTTKATKVASKKPRSRRPAAKTSDPKTPV